MAKASKGNSEYIEVQKGRIETHETDSLAFYPSEGPTRLDMEHLQMRRDGMTLTKHEPKR